MLEGGYDLLALQESLAQVGRALLGESKTLPEGTLRESERAAIAATRSALAPHWPALRA
jgi:hypothetical protein